MTTYERRQSILQLLQKQSGIRVPELAQMLSVSKGTIRNDLDALEEQGILIRVHGGAVMGKQPAHFDSSFAVRYNEHAKAKLVIARQAALLVEDGASILLDASTTVYYLAQELASRQRLRVITNGIDVARLLAKNSSNSVVLMGGVMAPDGSSVSGSLSEQIIRGLHVQKAFVSCSGFSMERGLTDVYLAEAELKAKALGSAREVFALVDSSKMGKDDLTPFASLNLIAHIYTDSGLSDEWAAHLKSAGIAFTVCSKN